MASLAGNSAASSAKGVWAVILVHGVGFNRPGSTLEAFTRSLLALRNGKLSESGPPEVRMLDRLPPVLPPRNYQRPAGPPPWTPLGERFPMHLRRVKANRPAVGKPSDAILAEVFWADLSATSNQVINLVLRTLAIVFHLRFVADRAANGPEGWGRWLRFFLYLTSSVLCGPLAACALLITALLVFQPFAQAISKASAELTGFSLREESIHVLFMLTCLVMAILIAALLRKRKDHDDDPWGLLLSWFVVMATALTLLAGWRWNYELSFDWIARWSPLTVSSKSLASVSLYVNVLVGFLIVSFIAMEVFLGLAGLAWVSACATAWWRKRVDVIPGLTLGLCALLLQLALWMLIVPEIASVAFHRFSLDVLDEPAFARLRLLLTLNAVLSVVVVAFAGYVWLRRLLWLYLHRRNYGHAAVAATIPRFLVHRTILGSLLVAAIAGSLVANYRIVFLESVMSPLMVWVDVFTAVAVPLAIWLLLHWIGSALHIMMDVIGHFMQRRLELPLPFGPERAFRLEDLVRQMKIEARFRRVLTELVNQWNVSHLTIVSHSQGTVIAVDSLWLDWTADLLNQHGVQELNLVTMGSPFTHLYQHYFPNRYPPLFLPANQFNSSPTSGWGRLHNTLQTRNPGAPWVNLFRVDDYVGTHINGNATGAVPFPDNRVLPRGGHIRYWTDVDVLAEFEDRLPG